MPRPKFAAVLVAMIACGGDSSAPGIDVTGTWAGEFGSNAGPPGYEPMAAGTMTLRLVQSGANVSGSFDDGCRSGSLAGGVSAESVQLRLGVPSCGGPANQPGSLTIAGTVSDREPGAPTIAFTYQGTACGVGEYGSGTLSRQ